MKDKLKQIITEKHPIIYNEDIDNLTDAIYNEIKEKNHFEFIKITDMPDVFKNKMFKLWEDRLKEDFKNMGMLEDPADWQILQNKEKMIFNSIFYRTTEIPYIYYCSFINKI
jgi:hypothetical protein